MENKMEEVAKLLGIKLDEEFKIDGYRCKYKLTDDGLMYWSYLDSKWLISMFFKELLTGKLKIIKLPKPILDDIEKEYLSNVIKPFRNRVFYITKRRDWSDEFIEICVNHYQVTDDYLSFELPLFKKGTMYTGMQLGKRYTLEELGL